MLPLIPLHFLCTHFLQLLHCISEWTTTYRPRTAHKDAYPVNSAGRKFHDNLQYKRRLPNGETDDRHWLVYSSVADRLFCFCCKLFSNRLGGSLATTSFSDWKHVGRCLSEHKKSTIQLMAVVSCMELEQRLKCSCTIDDINNRHVQLGRERWRVNRQTWQ